MLFNASHGVAWFARAWRGQAWRGEARLGRAGCGKAWYGHRGGLGYSEPITYPSVYIRLINSAMDDGLESHDCRIAKRPSKGPARKTVLGQSLFVPH